MAENTLQQENKSFRTEEIGGHQVQPVKMMLGIDNVDDGNIHVNNPMPVIDENTLIYRGLSTGKTHTRIFGENPDIDTATPENIWAAGGLFTFPPAAETFNIVSTSPLDNGVTPNTGARTVTITGLNAAYAEVSETLTLNGVTPVVSGTYTHIQSIEVITGGSTLANQGIITAVGNTSALTVAYITVGKNATSLGQYMVPAGKTAYLETLVLAATKVANTSALITGQWRPFGTDNVFRPFIEIGVEEGAVPYRFSTPISFPEKTQIKFLATVLSNTTNVSLFAELLLIDD